MEIPKQARIFIIEGVAGSGKTAFHNQLKEKLRDKLIYDYHEEELLFSWKHAWIKNMAKVRLEFMNRFLDYCEEKLKQHPDSLFILNRFHITFNLMTKEMDPEISKEYEKLIERLKKVPIHIFVPVIEEHEIEKRYEHKERKEKIWELARKEKLKTWGFSSFKEMNTWEQNKILELLKKQGIPYSTIRVSLDNKKRK